MRVKRVIGFITTFAFIFILNLPLIFSSKASANAKSLAGANVGVNVKEFIKLAVDTSSLALKDNNNNTVISPTSGGTLVTGNVNVAVTTNIPRGYNLSILTQDASTAMSHSDQAVDAEINATVSGATSLSAGTWGFQKPGDIDHWYPVGAADINGVLVASKNNDDAAFCSDLAYPLDGADAATECLASTYDTYSIGFGANLTPTLPSGAYANTVVFSAIANPESSRYTLNFDASGGSGVVPPRTILASSTVDLPEQIFTKGVFTIAGWALKTDPGDSDIIYPARTNLPVATLLADVEATTSSPVSANDTITLYAVWKTNSNVTVSGGIIGTSGSTTTGSYQYGETITLTATPGTGYHFTSWSKVGEGTLANSSISPTSFVVGTSDATITAASAANTYTINYAAGSTSGTCSISGTSATYDSDVALSSAKCTKSGYTQDGWSANTNGSTKDYSLGAALTKPNFAAENGGTYTLYPHFVANAHTVTINKAASDTPACSVTVHPTTTTGCKMADGRIWILGNSGNSITWNDIFTGATDVNGHDATVNSGICPAGYSAPKITDYDRLIQAYGGTAYSNSRNGYQETTGALYSMLGLAGTRYFWSSTERSSERVYILRVDSSLSDSSNYINKIGGGYVLCYQEDDGPIASVSGAGTYNYGSTVAISAAMITGYHFGSWTVNAGGISAPTGNPATFTMPDADVALTANGAANTYTINYAAGSTGGSCSVSGTSATYNSDVTLSSTKCTRSGYTQDGWSASTNGSTKDYNLGQALTKPNFTNVDGDTYTLYPHFVVNTHTVAISNNTGISSTTGAGTYNYGNAATISATASTGYHFTSWTVNAGGISAPTGNPATFTMPDADVALTANGAANTYTINYAAGSTGGSCSVSGTSATYNSDVTLSSTKCTRSGYTQDGWSASTNGSTKDYNLGASLTKPNFTSANGGTYTLYPHFTANSYTLNYAASPASINPKYSHTSNIDDGGTRSGDYGNSQATKSVVSFSDLAGVSKLKVRITYGTESSYDYVYVFQGTYTGSVTRNMSAGQQVTYNGNSSSPTTVEIEVPGDTVTFAFYSDSSVTSYGYYAVVTPLNSSGANSFAASGSTSSQTVTYGTNVTLRANGFTTPSGKVFMGWGTSSGGNVVYNAGQSVAPSTLKSNVVTTNGGSITLYAIWGDKVAPIMQNANVCSSVAVGTTETLKDSRDNQQYTVYRWPVTGTAGTDYPSGMAGYCLMTKSLKLGNVTGGSVTKDTNLTLDTSSSLSSGTITARTSVSSWSTSQDVAQYINNSSTGETYYSYEAAQKVCPKGWRPPTSTEGGSIMSFMGGDSSAASTKIRSAPYNFTISGIVYGTSFHTGGRGAYWYYGDNAFIDIGTSYLHNCGSDSKANGFPVRCVAAP